jgi:hypothetical protein
MNPVFGGAVPCGHQHERVCADMPSSTQGAIRLGQFGRAPAEAPYRTNSDSGIVTELHRSSERCRGGTVSDMDAGRRRGCGSAHWDFCWRDAYSELMRSAERPRRTCPPHAVDHSAANKKAHQSLTS